MIFISPLHRLLALFSLYFAYKKIRRRRRLQHYLLKSSLLLPSASPFHRLLCEQSDLPLINVFGFDRHGLNYLAELLKNSSYFSTLARRSTISPIELIGITLLHLRSHDPIRHICLMFGILL